jgi:hypothetical protein
VGGGSGRLHNFYHIFICTCRGKFAGKSPIRTIKTYSKISSYILKAVVTPL